MSCHGRNEKLAERIQYISAGHPTSFDDMDLSSINKESSGDTTPHDAPSDEIRLNLDLSALTDADRRAVLSFTPKKGTSQAKVANRPRPIGKLCRFFSRNPMETSADTAYGQQKMDAVYDELNQFVEQNMHDAIVEVVEEAGGKAAKLANFVIGYTNIITKFTVAMEENEDPVEENENRVSV